MARLITRGRRNYRAGIAVALALAIACSLWLASPAQHSYGDRSGYGFEETGGWGRYDFGYGGGGGGGAPPLPPGVTDVSKYTGADGVFSEDVTVYSEDRLVRVDVDRGTEALNYRGWPLDQISIIPMEDPPAPPANTNVIGLVYNIGPDGTTFDESVSITFTYDPALLPAGFSEGKLVIAIWDEEAQRWVELESVVDTEANTITVKVSHFTPFNIIAKTARPASFTRGNLSITPAEVEIGDEVTVTMSLNNKGDLSGTHEVVFQIDGQVESTTMVDVAGGATETVTFTYSPGAAGIYELNVDGLTGSFVVRRAAEASFTTSDLSLSPGSVDILEPVTISVVVTNSGDATGSYTTVLKVNGKVMQTKEVTLSGGASRTVTFNTFESEVGTYTVDIGDQLATFTVRIPPQPINWWPIIGIIGGCLIIVAIWYIDRRRRAV